MVGKQKRLVHWRISLGKFTLYNDDCLKILKTLPDNSIDSCVTDPPYGLSFMGKHWDYDVPSKEIWAEVLRVLKPGGHLLSFGGSRTYHRMACAIEDAGFEIRDQIMWLYGSGFPKSHNIGKAIDNAAGATRKILETKISKSGGMAHIMKTNKDQGFRPNDYYKQKGNFIEITEPATDGAKQWEGWGTALKPAHEPIVVARKPLAEKTVAENVLKYGTGAINIDGCRVGLVEGDDPRLGGKGSWKTDKAAKNVYEGGYAGNDISSSPLGRWPANVIHDGSDEVISGFPKTTSGAMKRTVDAYEGEGVTGFLRGNSGPHNQHGDSGSAARFFYCAKASKADRDEGLDEILAKKVVSFQTGGGASGKPSSLSAGRDTEYRNNHPTVKPTELMKYLIKLITPKNGTILDPFMGSGTTGKACGFEKYKFIGIEMNKDYFEIAEVRIKHAYQNKTANLEDFFS